MLVLLVVVGGRAGGVVAVAVAVAVAAAVAVAVLVPQSGRSGRRDRN